MASALSLLLKGLGALIFFACDALLLFVNGIIGPPIMDFILKGTYKVAFGLNMIPIIQVTILFMCLAGGIICFISAYIEIYGDVAYYAGG